MKRLLVFLISVGQALASISTPTCAIADDGGSGGTTQAVALTVTGGSGHVVVIAGGYSGSTCGPTPTTALIFTSSQVGDVVTALNNGTTNGSGCAGFAYIQNPTGGSNTYTLTSSFVSLKNIIACEVSGLATSSSNDVNAAINFDNSGVHVTSNAFTTTNANEIVFAYVDWNTFGSTTAAGTNSVCDVSPGCAIPSGALNSDNLGVLEYIILSSTHSSVTADFTRGAAPTYGNVAVASFHAPVTGPAFQQRRH